MYGWLCEGLVSYQNYLVFQLSLNVGLYHVFLRDWMAVFPQKNFHVLRLEDYSSNKIQELDKIMSFLGAGEQ